MIKAIANFLLHFFWLFKIKQNRVFFESYDGSQFSCSPKEIFEKILVNNKIESVWYLKKNVNFDNKKYQFIRLKRKGFLYYYYILTSRVLITNVNFSSYIPFRKKQVLINTWHGGGAYKFAIYKKSANEIQKAYSKFNFFLSSSNMFTEKVIRDTFRFKGTVLSCGLPRNDILYKDNSSIRKKICENYSIENNSFIVLYAPTYRDIGMDKNFETIDFSRLKDAFETKFKKPVVIFYRAHHFMSSSFPDDKSIVDVSGYSNMQELLAACDSLVTDYSSCMWDFSLTYKPCFLYAPDYDLYLKQRSFYTDIDKWGFYVAFSNNLLIENIINFKESEFKNRVKKMHDSFGSFETGNASKVIAELVLETINGTNKS